MNLNPERPDLRPGAVELLIQHERLGDRVTGDKQAVVLVHPLGHGSLADLATLEQDLSCQGFSTTVYGVADRAAGSPLRQG